MIGSSSIAPTEWLHWHHILDNHSQILIVLPLILIAFIEANLLHVNTGLTTPATTAELTVRTAMIPGRGQVMEARAALRKARATARAEIATAANSADQIVQKTGMMIVVEIRAHIGVVKTQVGIATPKHAEFRSGKVDLIVPQQKDTFKTIPCQMLQHGQEEVLKETFLTLRLVMNIRIEETTMIKLPAR